jgi:hypothetical protein
MKAHVMKMLPARFWRLFAIAAAVALFYTAIGFLVFPAVLKRIAVQELGKFLGRTVMIRKIDFNPYSMSLAAHGFQINEPSGGTILSWRTLHTTFAPVSSLLRHAWVFKGAVLLEPSVNIARNDRGSFNLSDLLLLDWPKNLRLRFDQMRLVNGKVLFRDAAVPGGFATTIGRLEVTVKDFSTLPDHDNSFSINADSESGERFSMNGFFRVHPLSSQGQIAAENVTLRTYSPYLKDRFDFTITDGALTGRASYNVNLARDGFTLLLHDAELSAQSLKVCEPGSTAQILGFAGLAVSGAQVDLVRQTVKADSIVVSGGSAFVRRLSDHTLNFQHLMKPVPRKPRDTVARLSSPRMEAPAAGWSVAVGEIRLTDFAAEVDRVFGHETVEWKELLFARPTFQVNPPTGSVAGISLRDGKLVFTDLSLEPPVRMALTLLDMRIGAFSSASPGLARVAVSARIDTLAPVQISGKTNPIGAPGETDVRGLVQNVNLVPLSPYTAKYLGYELTAGDFGLDVACVIHGRKLSLENTISIDRLTLGRKTESVEATKLPVALAIALLKDTNGRITLRVPIAVSLDEPGGDLKKALIEGVIHPFIMTAAFPFAALGAQSGGGGEELGFQEFSPGSADLIPREAGKLNVVLRGLKRWPEILLDIEGSVDSKNDTGDLHLLAVQRAEAVKEYLLRQGTLEPERIFLIESSPENVPRKGSRALLSLTDNRGSR